MKIYANAFLCDYTLFMASLTQRVSSRPRDEKRVCLAERSLMPARTKQAAQDSPPTMYYHMYLSTVLSMPFLA